MSSGPVLGEDPALDAESQQGVIISAAVVFVSVSSVLVLLRLYTRSRILRAVGPEDITILIAQILAIGTTIGTVIQVKNGLGRHTWTVDPESGARQLQALYATILIYNPAQIMMKVSLLCQFRRLFPGAKTHKVCLYMLILLGVWGVLQEFLAGMACIPLSLIAPSMADRCITTLPIWYLTSVMNIVTDFIVFSIPLPSVIKLQLRIKQKILLAGLLSLGFFTCIISIIRLFTLRSSIGRTDPMWDNAGTSYWSVIELNCGILCATLPTLRPFLRKVIPSAFSSVGASGLSGDPNTGRSKRSRNDTQLGSEGVYVQRDVELIVSSTTELKKQTPSLGGESITMAEVGGTNRHTTDIAAGNVKA